MVSFAVPNKTLLLLSDTYTAPVADSRCAGVYMLQHKASGKYYIGSSLNIRNRITDHIYNLNFNRHSNRYLLAAWNKYGAEAFEWFLVEQTEPEQAQVREQYYLDTFKPFSKTGTGYNIAKDVTACFKGRKHSDETKTKMSAANIGSKAANYGKKLSAGTREKIALALTGRTNKPLTDTHKQRLAATQSKSYTLISPDGKMVAINNLKAFANANGLSEQSLHHVLKGRTQRHKGWSKYIENES